MSIFMKDEETLFPLWEAFCWGPLMIMYTAPLLHVRARRVCKCFTLHTVLGLLCEVSSAHRSRCAVDERVFTRPSVRVANMRSRSPQNRHEWDFVFLLYSVLPQTPRF